MEPETAAPMAALPAPRTQLDCLPYVDTQYNDPAVRKQVDALVQAELKTFKPAEYLAKFPSFEPKFQVRHVPDVPKPTIPLQATKVQHPLLHQQAARLGVNCAAQLAYSVAGPPDTRSRVDASFRGAANASNGYVPVPGANYYVVDPSLSRARTRTHEPSITIVVMMPEFIHSSSTGSEMVYWQ
eukprot:6194020-Pleurochrysis_carterae.AAC.3